MPQQMPGLTIDLSSDASHVSHHLSSPIDLHGIDISSLDARDTQLGNLASLTPLPLSPDERERGAAKSFFGNRATSPSAGRIRDEPSVSTASMDPHGEASSHNITTWTQTNAKTPADSPAESGSQEGSRFGDANSPANFDGHTSHDHHEPTLITFASDETAPSLPPRSAPGDKSDAKKANKKRLQVLTRSKSMRAEDEVKKSKKSMAKKNNVQTPLGSTTPSDLSFRTVQSDKDKGKSSRRDKSEDRLGEKKEKSNAKEKQGHPLSSSLRHNNTSTFFNEFRNSSSNAAMGIGRAGKGLFSKFSRSGSTHEKSAAPVEDHIPSVLTLPLVEQTRITRIAKSYDHCKDKTEFWMPALPWRCIDYLNGKCEEEGLYRVSGGLAKVREWRKRFDTELDVNLLDEPELYDASIIASLFKEWIRELPEEIFPKAAQDRITAQLPRELPEKGSVSQLLRDELQHLSPFNYYLLFAITCHLSLLLSYEPKNKMTLDNLYRCFNQSLRLDGRIFYTLVGDWRQCWAGCLTENDFLKAEYDHLQHPYPQFMQGNDDYRQNQCDERAISSSGSSAPPAAGIFTPDPGRPATSHTQPSHSAEESEEFWLTPVRKSHRSSSDVTGMSPMKGTFGHTPRGSP